MNQRFVNWDCLVVDDGSTDNTEHVITEYSKKDSRFKYIYQKNSERSVARNNGADQATGEYLIFLDSDDSFELDHLMNLNKFIEDCSEKVSMFFTNAKILHDGIVKALTPIKETDFEIDFFIKNSIIPARVCLHNEILNNLNFDEDAIVVEDTVLWTEVLNKYPVFLVDVDSVIYHLHDDNSVNLKKHNAFKKRLHGLNKLFDKKEVGSLISNITKKEQRDNCYLGIAKHYRLNNKKSKEFYWLSSSLFRYPNIRTKEKLYLLKMIFSRKSKDVAQ
jgi:glycosyltransferase involved in cell wall biosynthesis